MMGLGFIPVHRPQVAIAEDGRLAAIHEPDRITFVTIPDASPRAVIAIEAPTARWVEGGLLVIAHGVVRAIAPHDAREVANLRLESAMHLLASVGRFALAAGDAGAAILSLADAQLGAHPLATVPVAAGAAGDKLVVATRTEIEEWEPAERRSSRRLRLPTTTTVTAVGGSPRLLWWTTREAPHRIEVTSQAGTRSHELGEPIAQVSSHPQRDLLACLGADTGRIHVVDLDRGVSHVIETAPVERPDAIGLVVAETVQVLACEVGRPTTIVSIVPRDPRWRDEVAAWTRRGTVDRVPAIPAIDDLARRMGLTHLTPAITLCYGAHLCGAPGVPPIDIANVLGGRWNEALGAGWLAQRGVLVYADSRVALAPGLCRLLDEL